MLVEPAYEALGISTLKQMNRELLFTFHAYSHDSREANEQKIGPLFFLNPFVVVLIPNAHTMCIVCCAIESYYTIQLENEAMTSNNR